MYTISSDEEEEISTCTAVNFSPSSLLRTSNDVTVQPSSQDSLVSSRSGGSRKMGGKESVSPDVGDACKKSLLRRWVPSTSGDIFQGIEFFEDKSKEVATTASKKKKGKSSKKSKSKRSSDSKSSSKHRKRKGESKTTNDEVDTHMEAASESTAIDSVSNKDTVRSSSPSVDGQGTVFETGKNSVFQTNRKIKIKIAKHSILGNPSSLTKSTEVGNASGEEYEMGKLYF